MPKVKWFALIGIGACILLVTFAGCIEKQLSPLQKESAVVVQKVYVPEAVSRTSGSGTGISTSGDVTFTSVDATTRKPEVWAIVLKCEKHDKTFAIDDNEIFNVVEPGMAVTLEYQEEFDVDAEAGTKVLVDVHTRSITLPSGSRVQRKAKQ